MSSSDAKRREGPHEFPYRIAQLISGFLEGRLSPADRQELDNWIAASKENLLLFEELTDEDNIASSLHYFSGLDVEGSREKTWDKIQASSKKNTVNRAAIFSIAASLLLFMAAAWLLWKPRSNDGAVPVTASRASPDLPAPPRGSVVLTMGSGTRVSLDSTPGGTSNDGGATIKNEKGLLVYQKNGGEQPVLNGVATGRGATYALQLSDGSRVWLNAASSLHFPTIFTSGERVVELTGEAYFEVAKDRTKPFKVKAGHTVVEVLGTHFNISAYATDEAPSTTLLEGRVRLSSAGESRTLLPGQQGVVRSGSIHVKQADLESVMAWKEGLFFFRDAGIKEVAAQLQQWYDVTFVYQEEIVHHFNGPVPRHQSLQKTLAMLEGPNRVHFKIEGKKIIVTR